MTPDAEEAAPPGREAAVNVSAETLAWLAVAAVFVAFRLGAAFEAPVGGAELVHLSGAWQARIGVEDSRFVPTLFQALCATLLYASSSELPSRLLAVAATATVPLALYLLRGRLGNAGALLALLLIAFDPPGILLGGTASALGFDVPVAIWVFVALSGALPVSQRRALLAVYALLGLLVATGGPFLLPLSLTVVAFALFQRRVERDAAVVLAAGCLTGVVLTSVLAGEPRVAALVLFSAGFEQAWSGPLAGEVLILYALPIVAPGLAAAGLLARNTLSRRSADRQEALLVAWSALAGAWLLLSLTTHSFVPVAALTLPLALILGPAASRAFAAMWRADWKVARVALPASAAFALLALAVSFDWARDQSIGGFSEKARVAYFLVAAVGAALALFLRRGSGPAVASLAFAACSILLVTGAFGMAVHPQGEPLPSPFSGAVARDLRDRAVATRGESEGSIVIHDSLKDQATWPFRDSGNVVFASRVPIDAAFVVWPATLPAPAGLKAVEGNFALTASLHTPLNDGLDYLHWLIQRNTLAIRPATVAVYTRQGQ